MKYKQKYSGGLWEGAWLYSTFLPVTWNADEMAGDLAAILDQEDDWRMGIMCWSL